MLKLCADFHCKYKYILTQNCVVEKTIQLPGAQFDSFSANLLKDWDFIKDNKDHMYFGDDDVSHCLLITGEGRENGILVHSEGYDYARYTAYVPDVHTIVEAHSQSPALKILSDRLSTFVEYAADEYLRMLESGERASLYLAGRARDFDIEMDGNGMLWDTVVAMIGERLSELNLDMEIDNGDLILTPREPDMHMEM